MAIAFTFPNWTRRYVISAEWHFEMNTTSIYAQALGSGFTALAPVLKRLHGTEQRRLAGILQIRTAKHPLAGFLLWLCRLPRVQAASPTQLWVVPCKDGERWLRYFGHRQFFTFQRNQGSNAARSEGAPATSRAELLERFGPITLHLRLCVKGQSLTVRSRATRLFGMKLPQWLGIRVVAHERPIDESTLYCDIRLFLPWLGGLLQYKGTLSFQNSLN